MENQGEESRRRKRGKRNETPDLEPDFLLSDFRRRETADVRCAVVLIAHNFTLVVYGLIGAVLALGGISETVGQPALMFNYSGSSCSSSPNASSPTSVRALGVGLLGVG